MASAHALSGSYHKCSHAKFLLSSQDVFASGDSNGWYCTGDSGADNSDERSVTAVLTFLVTEQRVLVVVTVMVTAVQERGNSNGDSSGGTVSEQHRCSDNIIVRAAEERTSVVTTVVTVIVRAVEQRTSVVTSW